MNLTGITLGGYVNQANKQAELGLQQQQVGIQQQNADTARMGVQAKTMLELRAMAQKRADATLTQAANIVSQLPSQADIGKVQRTINNLREDFTALASAGYGIEPDMAQRHFDATLQGTPTQAQVNTQAAGKAAAVEAAQAANAAPTIGHFVDSAGNQHLIFSQNGKVVNTVNLGAVQTPQDLGKARLDLALRSQGQNVQNPDIQRLTPQQAMAASNVLGSGNPVNAAIAGALGGFGGDGAPQTDVVGALADRINKGGKISPAEWNALSKPEQADLQSRVTTGRPPAAVAPAPPSVSSAPLAVPGIGAPSPLGAPGQQ